jgi:uncharacterized membrane protein YkoI
MFMTQRTALLGAATITAFVLVLLAGVLARVSQPGPPPPTPVAQAIATADSTAVPTADASPREREQAYRGLLEDANQRLQQASEQQAALEQRYEQLRRTAEEQLAAQRASGQPASVAAPAPAEGPGPAVEHSPAPPAAVTTDSAPALDMPAPVPALAAPPTVRLSPAEAATAALRLAPGSRAIGLPELVSFQGATAYEARLDRGTVYVDANTGAVLSSDVGPPPAVRTTTAGTRERVLELARAYAGEQRVKEIELKRERGMSVYEVVFTSDSKVYVDPARGEVVFAKLKRAESSTSRVSREREHEDEDDDDD